MNEAETLGQIASVIQSSLAVNGQLAFPFYKQFWANLHESPECAACYLAVLLSKLVGITSGEDKYTPLPDLVAKIVSESYTISASEVQKLAPDGDPALMALKQSILLTLYFIGIHIRFAVVHPSMNLAFAKWIEFNAIQRWVSAKTPFVDEVISILTGSFDNDESLTQLIDNATTVDVPMDLCQDLGDARNLSLALLSAWLVRGSSFPLPKLIGGVLDALKKDNLPESRVLVLLHMLKKLIIHTPYLSHATIHNALSLLKTYYLWPRPYGDYARSVMTLLSAEAKNPGHTLRDILLHEFPSVLKDHAKIKYNNNAPPLGRGAGGTQGQGRGIHMLVDTQHCDGSVLHDLLKSCPADDPSPAQLQIDILGNILYRVLGIESDVLGLEHCPSDLIADLLVEALNVMDHAATLPEKDARAFRLQHIKAIRERIMESAEFDSYAYPPRHPAPPSFHMSIIQLKCSNTRPRRSEDLTDSQLRIPLRKNCVQILSQIFSSYQHQNRSQNMANGTPLSPTLSRAQQKVTPNPPNFAVPQDANTKPNQKNQQPQPAPNHTLSSAPPHPPSPRLVRIAIIGSDATLHNVVTGYVTLRREQPTLFTGLEVRFYVIPIACATPLTISASLPNPLGSSPAPNHFASFIAKNDPWYYRHIWVGSYALTSILPSGSTSLSISQLADLAVKNNPHTPSTTSQTNSPRQRSKSRALASPDIDRLASSGALVESLKAVQKQKFVANSFLAAKPLETDATAGASGMVGNGRLSTEASNKSDGSVDDNTREDRSRTGSGGNNNNSPLDTKSITARTTSSDKISVTHQNAPIHIPTASATNNASTNNAPENITTTITTNANGEQEIIISGSSTEVLVLKKQPHKASPANIVHSTSTNTLSTATPATPVSPVAPATPATPASPATSIPLPTTSTTSTSTPSTTPDTSPRTSWTTDAATADGTRRNGSVGSSSTPSPSRSRSNSGNTATDSNGNNGIVVGQSRTRSGTNNPPVPNGYSLNKSASSGAIEGTKSDASANPTVPGTTSSSKDESTSTPAPSPPSAAANSIGSSKAIFRRSNSLSDNLQANAQEEPVVVKRHPLLNKSTLQHSHSIASFNYETSNSQTPTTSPLSASNYNDNDVPLSSPSPSSVLQAPSPARMLRQEFDTYIRDASQYLNVAVFQAECWTTIENENLYFTVPFFIRAELGIGAYARLFAETNDLPSSITQQDIITHKLFKYNAVPISLKCTPVNLNGVARGVQAIEPKPYVSISVSNLGPLDKAQQNNANPTRPWLEMSTVEAESKKRKKEEFHTYYVNVVDMETEGKKLVDVLLDGEYYGGVYKLRITTCTAPPLHRISATPTSATPPTTTTPTTSATTATPTSTASTTSPAPPPPSSSATPTSSPLSTSSSSLPAATEEEHIVFPVMTYLPLNLP